MYARGLERVRFLFFRIDFEIFVPPSNSAPVVVVVVDRVVHPTTAVAFAVF